MSNSRDLQNNNMPTENITSLLQQFVDNDFVKNCLRTVKVIPNILPFNLNEKFLEAAIQNLHVGLSQFVFLEDLITRNPLINEALTGDDNAISIELTNYLLSLVNNQEFTYFQIARDVYNQTARQLNFSQLDFENLTEQGKEQFGYFAALLYFRTLGVEAKNYRDLMQLKQQLKLQQSEITTRSPAHSAQTAAISKSAPTINETHQLSKPLKTTPSDRHHIHNLYAIREVLKTFTDVPKDENVLTKLTQDILRIYSSKQMELIGEARKQNSVLPFVHFHELTDQEKNAFVTEIRKALQNPSPTAKIHNKSLPKSSGLTTVGKFADKTVGIARNVVLSTVEAFANRR